MKPRVLMVHGAFCGPWTFDRFRRPFEAAGYTVEAVALPGHGDRDAQSAVSGLSMTAYARALADRLRAEPTPPLVVAHSMGGLASMMAAMDAPAAALILLAPSPPWGIASGTLEEGASSLGLLMRGAWWCGVMDPDRFVARLYSLDRLAPETAAYVSRRMRPESGRALSETLNWWSDPFATTRVTGARINAPVFVGVGERDLIHPPSTARQTAALLGAELEIFPRMSHWLIGEPGWETVAEACLQFAERALAPN